MENDYVEHRKRVSQIEKELTPEPTSLKEISPDEKIVSLVKQIEAQTEIEITVSDSNMRSEINDIKNNFNISTRSAERMIIFCQSHYCHIPTDSLL